MPEFPSTPLRSKPRPEPSTHPSPPPSTPRLDYKARTHELMAELTDARTTAARHHTESVLLKQKLAKVEEEVRGVLTRTGCAGLRELTEGYQAGQLWRAKCEALAEADGPRLQGQVTEILGIVRGRQETGMAWEELRGTNRALAEDNQRLARSNEDLGAHVRRLKAEVQHLQAQNSSLRVNVSKLKQDLSTSIGRFEDIERVVDSKMEEYILKIRQYQQIIDKNRDYSLPHFGSSPPNIKIEDSPPDIPPLHPIQLPQPQQFLCQKCKQKQDPSPPDMPPSQHKSNEQLVSEMEMNLQCYRASIEGLLEENRRLKKSFQNLYRLKEGETLPEDLMKEITIMKSIIDLKFSHEGKQE